MTRWLSIITLVACGDNRAVLSVDASPCGDAACIAPCSAVLTGNVDETSSSLAQCPTLQPGAGDSMGHTMIDFLLPSAALATQLAVRIDLGPTPTPGSYSSETTTIWSAIGIEPVPLRGSCIFTAGNSSVPAGDFTLDLVAITPSTAHGSLALTMFVLPFTNEQGIQTDCGTGTTEDLEMRF